VRPRVALFGVDAFTDRQFGGNPAMVCLLPEPADDEWMRRVAAELNQPATAFLHDRRLRWFTPAVGLPLCGHATLATAHVLYEAGLVDPADPVVFETVSGPLRAWRRDGLVWIGFAPVAVQEADAPGAVVEALGLQSVLWFGWNEDEYVIVLGAPGQVEAIRPDLASGAPRRAHMGGTVRGGRREAPVTDRGLLLGWVARGDRTPGSQRAGRPAVAVFLQTGGAPQVGPLRAPAPFRPISFLPVPGR
jgi:predicted PhzF superfamily epimerase YddE/YHI9